jgi:hypothetical protein
MAESDQIARLRITLDDVAPVILRRIEVPVGVRLDAPLFPDRDGVGELPPL